MLKSFKILVRMFIKRKFSLIEKPTDTINLHKTLREVVHGVSTTETLKTIQRTIQNEEKGAYLRFGDGDVYLLIGRNDSFQKSNEQIKIEMREAFELKGGNVFKTLPIHSHLFGFEKGMFEGNHLLKDSTAIMLLEKTYPYFISHKIYSTVALHFIAAKNPEIINQFLHLLKLKTGLLIANEKTSDKTKKLLFGEVPFVKTPSTNSYDEIERIFKEAKEELSKHTEFQVVVVAMGCSGRILMKRLVKENYNVFLFDFGSLLDGIDGNISRDWLRLNDIDYKSLTKGL